MAHSWHAVEPVRDDLMPGDFASAISAATRLFGVQILQTDRDRCRGSAELVPHITGTGADFCQSALGVLFDDIVGTVLLLRRSPGRWVVSTEISMEFCHWPGSDTGRVTAEAWPVEITELGGLVHGAITDERGQTVATGSQRLRFVPQADPASAPTEVAVAAAPPRSVPAGVHGAATLALLGGSVELGPGTADVTIPTTAALKNPSGFVHGGVLLCAADIAGMSAADPESSGFVTDSIHVSYLRPTMCPGTVRFHAEVQHRGRSFRVAHVAGTDAFDRVCTLATVTASRTAPPA